MPGVRGLGVSELGASDGRVGTGEADEPEISALGNENRDRRLAGRFAGRSDGSGRSGRLRQTSCPSSLTAKPFGVAGRSACWGIDRSEDSSEDGSRGPGAVRSATRACVWATTWAAHSPQRVTWRVALTCGPGSSSSSTNATMASRVR
jgi:hypothetical protein